MRESGRDQRPDTFGGSNLRRTRVAAAALAAISATSVALTLTATPTVAATTSKGADQQATQTKHADDLVPAWRAHYDELRQQAVQQRLRDGGTGAVEKVGHGRYARVAQTGTDRIFVVLAEFGDTRHSAYPDDPESGAQRFDGPLHNEIPKPNRKEDNSTLWQKDYDQAYFKHMYFDRMKNFYEQQSSGKYSISGAVTDWVKVPFNEARYGSDSCGAQDCSVGFLIRDALAEWTQDKLDAGWDMPRIEAYLATFDKQDRYDFDEDGDFTEPDGYIDHFQIVHAGGDQADGDPIFASDAIWSHRGNADVHGLGEGPGPAVGGVNVGEGGISDPSGSKVQIPDNPTGVWVSDYTIQPENGGLSVFSHEFGHDLGLPDLYDTASGDNNVEHWDLMAQSRGTLPSDDGIGDQPQSFGAWDKFQLGWLDYDVVRSGRTATRTIRPNSSTSGASANGLIVVLPDKQVTFDYGQPCDGCGEKFFYSGQGNSLDNTMTLPVDGGGELTAQVRYDIEEAWDYAFLEVSSDDGETWESIPTSESYEGADQGSFNPDGTGITGTTDGRWVDLTASVPDGTTTIRWRYLTDIAATYPGFQVDQIALDGTTIGTAEANEGWAMEGFRAVPSTEVKPFLNAYFVDNRQYVGRDKVLSHVYNFGRAGTKKENLVDFFRYSPGALITYWDTSYPDNDVSSHPGGGELLPVDAHPEFQHAPDGSILRTKVLTADSAFSLKKVRAQKMHYEGKRYTLDAQRAVPTFDDTLDWWYGNDEHTTGEHDGFYQPGWFGVDVPKTGTTISVVKVNRNKVMTVKVGRS